MVTPVPATTWLTLQEAAELCGCSIDTIKRDRSRGSYPGARQDGSPMRTWRLPVDDLVSAGRLSPSLVEQAQEALAAHRESIALRELREENVRLRTALAAAEVRNLDLDADRAVWRDLAQRLAPKAA